MLVKWFQQEIFNPSIQHPCGLAKKRPLTSLLNRRNVMDTTDIGFLSRAQALECKPKAQARGLTLIPFDPLLSKVW